MTSLFNSLIQVLFLEVLCHSFLQCWSVCLMSVNGLFSVLLMLLLQVCLKYYEYEFMELACQSPAVVCCRCAPTQKAQIVRLLQERTGKLTCAVGEYATSSWPCALPVSLDHLTIAVFVSYCSFCSLFIYILMVMNKHSFNLLLLLLFIFINKYYRDKQIYTFKAII